MTESEKRKLVVFRIALEAIEKWLRDGRPATVDIEALIVKLGYQDGVTEDEAYNAIEESLTAAFRL